MSTMLTALIRQIPPAPMFLFDLVIGNRVPTLSGNSTIRMQLYKGGSQLAPLTTRTVGGIIMTHIGYTEWDIEAPLLGPMWDMSRAYETMAMGEDQFQINDAGQAVAITTTDRVKLWKDLRLAEGKDMVRRRIEWMIAQQLTQGTINLTGRGGYAQSIDLDFDNNVDDLTAWDAEGSDPIEDLMTLRNESANAGVPIPNVLVMSPNTQSAFIKNANVKARLLNNVGQIDPIFGSKPLDYPAAYRIGYISEIDTMCYAYGATYTSDEGDSTPFIPSGMAVYFPSNQRNQVLYAYGAVRDARENAWFSEEFYVREFADISGHSEWLEINSRPVACMAEVDSWYSLSGLVTPPASS